jgi:hypothetical protein
MKVFIIQFFACLLGCLISPYLEAKQLQPGLPSIVQFVEQQGDQNFQETDIVQEQDSQPQVQPQSEFIPITMLQPQLQTDARAPFKVGWQQSVTGTQRQAWLSNWVVSETASRSQYLDNQLQQYQFRIQA